VAAHLLKQDVIFVSGGSMVNLLAIWRPASDAHRRAVAEGLLPAGHATEVGVALHYVGSRLHRAVAVLPDRRAWRVVPDQAAAVEPDLWLP
jgi:peptidase E